MLEIRFICFKSVKLGYSESVKLNFDDFLRNS